MIIKINKSKISNKHNTYFIADIAANHDGNLKRAKELIRLASLSGANAAKFQNFLAETIVSEFGFRSLKKKLSHQSQWKKSVFQVYKKAELPLRWTEELKETCDKYNIDYFTAPYDLNLISYLNRFVAAWKLGSGDITWHENIIRMAKTKKPILIATGASTYDDVKQVVNKVKKINKKIVLMQCNTNYTASPKNYKFINLNTLKVYKKKFPDVILGLSDHTFGHETVLGAIALGARVVEKHFTDKNSRLGPDHKFSMNPKTWHKMVEASRKLELSLGLERKIIEQNETETVILQRRSVRAARDLKKNDIITDQDLVYLRPCPENAIEPYRKNEIVGKKLKKNIKYHEILTLKDLK